EYWEWMDWKENVVGYYSWENFQPPGLELVEITDNGADGGDADTFYDNLEVNLTFQVKRSGIYHLSAELSGAQSRSWLGHGWVEKYLTPTENQIKLTFDGSTIYSSGENGPYRLWLLVSDENWEFVLDNEYLTQAYSYENFQRPPAEISSIGPDNGLDTDGDNMFNYLSIDVKLNVKKDGRYRLSGTLYDNNYWHIGWADNEIDLSSGDNRTVTLSFEGFRVRASKKPGPYRVEISLYEVEREEKWYWGWRSLDRATYLTGFYSPDNFDTPPIEFTSTILDNVIDTNNDGYYDYLVVSVGVRVSESGRYSLGGSLMTEWMERENAYPRPPRWITWADNEFWLDKSDNEQIVQLSFPGVRISQTDENGPYRAEVYLNGKRGDRWEWYGSISRVTAAYSASNFQPAPIKFVRNAHLDYGLDTDGDNLYDFLVVEAKVDVKKTGSYIMGGRLLPSYVFTMKEVSFSTTGEQTIKLMFPGANIYGSKVSGSFNVDMAAIDKNWDFLDFGSHITSSYAYEKFDPPAIELLKVKDGLGWEKVDITDSAVDIDNDNLNDYLIVNVGVRVRENGTYRVMASLGPSKDRGIDWVENTVKLTVENNSVRLRFDGYAIVKRELSGKLWLWVVITDSAQNWLDSGWTETKSAYSYKSFEETKSGLFAITAKRLGTAAAGETIATSLENTEFVNSIELKAKDTIGQPAVLEVTERKTPPPGAKDTGAEELGYLDLTVSDSSKIKEGIIHFKVKKSDVDPLGLDPSSIKIKRYIKDTGEWAELETTKENEDAQYYYFSAKTPGFSWFVVVGKVQQQGGGGGAGGGGGV
ncbi:MAG: PGF-pre-PGF domain-containing protein, partial [Candidatus Hadarchaeales archaeon]